MPIKLGRTAECLILMSAIFALGIGCRLWAATVEVENEDDDISVIPTPAPKAMNPQVTPSNDKGVDADIELQGEEKEVLPSPTPVKKPEVDTPTPSVVANESQVKKNEQSNSIESTLPRVRINDNVGFYYFVSAGFMISDNAQMHSIGKVIGNADTSLNFSMPKRTYIELASDHYEVRPDDLLVVFHSVPAFHDSHSTFPAYQIENLAIVKVIEIQKRRVLVEVKESFRTFQDGDLVETYENEIKRWKQAQIKKVLPSHPVKCFVMGGELSRQNYEQTDFIFLSAGSKAGVVEGQKFELREIDNTGAMEEPLHALRGVAQVISAGLRCSTAQIISNSESIKKGFEAVYQP